MSKKNDQINQYKLIKKIKYSLFYQVASIKLNYTYALQSSRP